MKTSLDMPQDSLGRRILSLFKSLEPEDIVTPHEFVRIGRDHDGGYIMCQDLIAGNIAYSFGINDDVSWDMDMARRGFDVFMYDHTISKLPENDDHFNFFRTGITGHEETEELKTLKTLVERNGHSNNIDMILKMDVEGSEWDVFSSIDDDLLVRFSQIVIEIHNFESISDNTLYSKMEKSLTKLQTYFAPVHIHANNFCDLFIIDGIFVPPVFEITYVARSKLGTRRSSKTFPTPFDQPNNINRPDIQLGSFRFSSPSS
jgi:hypothetical protein